MLAVSFHKHGEHMATTNTTNGISFLGVLAIVFIVLKLVGVIAWSWFWVLSPILIPLFLKLLAFLLGLLLAIGASRDLR